MSPIIAINFDYLGLSDQDSSEVGTDSENVQGHKKEKKKTRKKREQPTPTPLPPKKNQTVAAGLYLKTDKYSLSLSREHGLYEI